MENLKVDQLVKIKITNDIGRVASERVYTVMELPKLKELSNGGYVVEICNCKTL